MLCSAILLSAMLSPAPPSYTAVNGGMICKVQHIIQRQQHRWSLSTCDRVAEAIARTFNPLLVLAVAINESDLQESARARARGRRNVYDVGLMGVRCRLGRDHRCSNWPVRGRTLQDLFDPAINIAAAELIMKRKRQHSPHKWLQHYNGGTRDRGYAERIHALHVALKGRRVHSASNRVNVLTGKIVQVVSVN